MLPSWQTNIGMENHIVSWVNRVEMVIFNRYMLVHPLFNHDLSDMSMDLSMKSPPSFAEVT